MPDLEAEIPETETEVEKEDEASAEEEGSKKEGLQKNCILSLQHLSISII